MKKISFIFATAILLGFGLQSCNREDNNGDNNGGGSGDDNSSVVWVDLGLPSGLLWADRNVGASSPEDFGGHYAWGETALKTVYKWSTYAYGSDFNALTKYCFESNYGLNGFTDNLTTLQASDDAATANLGDGARTPTEEEWQELIDYTTSTWTIRNGVNGRLLTAANSKSIFLPAAGQCHSLYFYGPGENGDYWSSALYQNNPSAAWVFAFDSDSQNMQVVSRIYGFSVRAVRARQN